MDIASTGVHPARRDLVVIASMIRMPFITETPNSEMKPMAAEMLNSRPEIYSAIMPPVTAKGSPASASRLSRS